MGGEEDALTVTRLGFDFSPRETRSFMGNDSPLDHVVKIFLPRADFFPFPCTAAFFARSKADVLSFTIVAGEARTGLRH